MSDARATLIALLFGVAADLISIISELAPPKSALVDVGAINREGLLTNILLAWSRPRTITQGSTCSYQPGADVRDG